MIPTCILVAVLAQAEPAAECQRDDNACKARRHERRAEAATTPEDRAYYLHLAHRSYLFSFDRSRDTADLCAARRNFDASLAVEGQSMKQRESTVAVEKDLQAREGAAHTSCRRQDRKSQRARTSEPPTRIAAASPDELRSDLPVHAQAVGTNVTPGDLDELRRDPLRAQAVEKAQGDSAAPLAELAATQAPAIQRHTPGFDRCADAGPLAACVAPIRSWPRDRGRCFARGGPRTGGCRWLPGWPHAGRTPAGRRARGHGRRVRRRRAARPGPAAHPRLRTAGDADPRPRPRRRDDHRGRRGPARRRGSTDGPCRDPDVARPGARGACLSARF
jgi:hypothetical protein